MSSVEFAGFTGNEKNFQEELSEKITELEEMQKSLSEHSANEINDKLKEISELQKLIEEYHASMQKENLEKHNAIKELKKKTNEMKRLQTAVKVQRTIKEKGVKTEKKSREHKHYKLSINHTALKQLEGVPRSSFVALAQEVILIDGKPYNKETLTLSKERQKDFRRLIEHYAVLEVIGKRKYKIKRVYSEKQREDLSEIELTAMRESHTPKK